MPGFHVSDFPIVLNYSNESFDVVNVLTGQRDVLIQGTAHNLWNQQGSFLTNNEGQDVQQDFHFCTVQIGDGGEYMHNWCCFTLESDFFEFLRSCGRLPPDTLGQTSAVLQQNT